MIQKEFLPHGEHVIVRTTFVLPGSLQADKIYLVGDFNDWNPSSHPLMRDGQGNWVFVLELEAGRAYQFRYLCDGVWMNDSDGDAHVLNRYGTNNFVVVTDPNFKRYEGAER